MAEWANPPSRKTSVISCSQTLIIYFVSRGFEMPSLKKRNWNVSPPQVSFTKKHSVWENPLGKKKSRGYAELHLRGSKSWLHLCDSVLLLPKNSEKKRAKRRFPASSHAKWKVCHNFLHSVKLLFWRKLNMFVLTKKLVKKRREKCKCCSPAPPSLTHWISPK